MNNQLLTKIVGLSIVIVGLYLLIGLFISVPFLGALLRYWPVTLIVLGLAVMFGSKERSGVGAVLTMIGLLFFGSRNGLLDTATGKVIADILLILLGIMVVVGFVTPKDDTPK